MNKLIAFIALFAVFSANATNYVCSYEGADGKQKTVNVRTTPTSIVWADNKEKPLQIMLRDETQTVGVSIEKATPEQQKSIPNVAAFRSTVVILSIDYMRVALYHAETQDQDGVFHTLFKTKLPCQEV